MNPQKQTISKADAANRQLTVAIRMYLNGGDMVAIHTLARAREIYESTAKWPASNAFMTRSQPPIQTAHRSRSLTF
jgi:hypothetical protein